MTAPDTLERAHGWRAEALCALTDAALFHPQKSQSAQPAKAVCAVCPVRPECLDYALTHDEHGVWGGLSRKERNDLRRQQRRAA